MEPTSSDVDSARLVALREEVCPAEYVLEAAICTIGRSPQCQIIVDQHTISRVHARIERNGPRYILRDAESINGTFVNGQRIREPHLLKDDDVIGLGSSTSLLRFLDPDPTAVSASALHYDEHARAFYVGRQRLELSSSLFRLLSHLYEYAGEVCSHESCAHAIWGPEYDADQLGTLDRVINRLRAKLRQVDPASDLIENQRGQGYKLVI